ncbi:MAG: COX15/CtaA family protein [Pseudomonadales bacterium]|nr:COX15/CtaA family protein [Pseudomonadales bacterium]
MSTAISQRNNDRQIAIWLLFCAGAIFCMVILGGATRLTHSGLSMVEWKPVVGVIPPLGESAWQETFEKYKQFPEYKSVNLHMSLKDFKSIFYFEYFHRLLGRLIGVLFLLPFLYFLARGMIKKPLIPRLIVMFILGGLQGVLGWYMVKSGLVKDPQVSQYRLTAHLAAAVAIYVYILWVAFGLLSINNVVTSFRRLYQYGVGLVALIILMIISGGFVAGTRAGLAYNTFPLMNGDFIPPNLYTLEPYWLNLFENITTIQFNHRMIAYLLILVIPPFCVFVRQATATRRCQRAAGFFMAMLAIQVTLGVSALLTSVPVFLGVAHQGGAILLLTVALFIARELKPTYTNS